jgi:hypothetical protein
VLCNALVFGMARPKTLDAGENKTFRLDSKTRNILSKYADEGETQSETLRRVLAEFDEMFADLPEPAPEPQPDIVWP